MLLGNLLLDVQSLCYSFIFLISLYSVCSVLLYSHLQLDLFDLLFLTLDSFLYMAHSIVVSLFLHINVSCFKFICEYKHTKS